MTHLRYNLSLVGFFVMIVSLGNTEDILDLEEEE